MTRMLVLLLLASAVEAGADAGRHAPELVTDEALVRADEFGADWLMYSRNYSGHRFSPLDQVDTGNVDDLVPQWAFSLGALGAQESTPVVHRGVMYVTSNAAALHAIAADTGELLWSFDSEPPEDVDDFTSTSVNRGAAIYKDRVIWNNLVGTIYCHDARTGDVIWRVTPDYFRLGYSKTQAPLIVKGMVITGTTGGEHGVRGFLEALDAETGERVWKTYTIPAPGEPGHETWPQDSDAWEHGGAPTWISGAFDPELDLIYWTTGNGGPWSSEQRSGDNLYTCSVLAFDADTGAIRWHYQFVPNDDWDYDANVTPVLTQIDHEGESTPVIALAIKTGFLYVRDRRNGRFLKAVKCSTTPSPPFWATGLDPETGRPIESSHARPSSPQDSVVVSPSAAGAANWFSTAFHPERQLMIIVANETQNHRFWTPTEYVPGEFFIADNDEMLEDEGMFQTVGEFPGRVCAYDLRTMTKRWEASPELDVRWGGPLATAGDLVFSGTLRGTLQALDADDGETLWEFQTGSGIMAHPITYSVDGKQYVVIVSGLGFITNPGFEDLIADVKNHNGGGMVFAFALP